RDLARLDGRFVIPVAAKPAAPFSLVARSTSLGDGAAAAANASPDPGAFVNFGTLTLAPRPPGTPTITPANGAEVDASAAVVQAAFDMPIDPASISAFTLSVPGTAVMNGSNTIRFNPAEPLRAGTRYTITVGASIRGTNGTPFGRTLVSQFTTRAIPQNDTSIHRERIRITLPDAGGKSTISGTAGALPGGAQAIAVRRGRLFIDVYQTTVAGDGSFSFDAGQRNEKDHIATSDTIDLQVLDSVSHAIVAVVELTPFVTADGKGFLAPADRAVTFTSADDITVAVPAGAFDTPTLVRVAPEQKSAFASVPAFDNDLDFAAAINLQLDGTAKEPLQIDFPAPANADPNRTWILGHLGDSVRGPKIEIVDFLRVAGGKFTTRPETMSGNARTLRATAISSDTRRMLLGTRLAGMYAAVDLKAQVGWSIVDGVAANVDLFSYFESLFVSTFALIEKRGSALIPVPAGQQFTVTGVDSSTGLESFRKTYDPIAAGTPSAPIAIPSPIDDDAGPLPVYATPARLDVVDAAPEGVRVESVRDVELVVDGGSLSVRNLAADKRRITVVNAATAALASAEIAPNAQAGFGPATPGDRLILTLAENDVHPDLPIAVVFDKAIFTGDGDADAYLHTHHLVALKAGDDASSLADITDQVTFSLDSRGTRVTLALQGALQRGKLFALVVSRNLAALGPNGTEGLKLAQRKINGTNGPLLASDLVLWFRTRTPAGELRETSLANGVIRDFSMHGNVAVVSALTGGLQAFDLSDPAALDGAHPAGRLVDDVDEFWGVATDRHGRIFATGMTPMLTYVHSYRLEDFLPATPGTTRDVPATRRVGSAMLTWRLGFASSMPLGSTTAFLTDRPEAIPRKLQLAVVDNELPMTIAQLGTAVATLANGFKKYNVAIAADPQMPYQLQRITIENRTLALHWSADAPRGGSAQLNGVVAREGDELFVVRNQRTYGVVSLFGYGIGVWDLNAIESNDHAVDSNYKSLREGVAMTDAKQPQEPIRDLSFTPEAMIRTQGGSSDLFVYALESNRGVVDVTVTPPHDELEGEAIPSTGLALSEHPRLRTLQTKYEQSSGGRTARPRFTSIAAYGDYALVAARDFGIAVLKLDGTALGDGALVDVIWIPAGAYSVRVMPNSDLAVAVDGAGRVLLIDLKRIDEHARVSAAADLFPTALASIGAQAATLPANADWYEVGADDPRILWKSKPHLVAGTLAPLVDADTGFLLAGDVADKKLHVISATDPRLRVVSGDQELASVVPLGVPASTSTAAFHLELSLPGAIADSLGVSVESERVPGADTEQTPAPYPPSHLRRVRRDGTPDTRPTTLALRRQLPSDANDPELARLRYQNGYNRLVSDTVVALADPRASKDWSGSRGDCASCERPPSLTSFVELYTLGRYLAIRAEAALFGRRLETRIATVPADTVRPGDVRVAAQHPPIAEGLLQETTYLHSGEVESGAVDYDAGGRAGWNVAFDRTYRSRTLGLSPMGGGWDSSLFQRLRALPNGDVEYRDGGGELWLFAAQPDGYRAPAGLFLRLQKTDDGYRLFDQQWRLTEFDSYGRVVAESDEFRQLRDRDSGNTIRYFYDGDGRLARVVDPVGRESTLAWDRETGLLKEISDWHASPRRVTYAYDAQRRLTSVQLPQIAGSPRSTIRYAYATSLESITDPGESTPRVKFDYDANNRVTRQTWGTGESATFVYGASVDVTDVLGQLRRYTLTADRAHVSEVHEVNVPVFSGAPFGQLPPTLAAGAAPITSIERVRRFTYDNGVLTSSKLDGVSETSVAYQRPIGAPGLVVSSISGDGITRTFQYQSGDNGSTFLQAVEAGGKRIESPAPHRNNRQPAASNSGIAATQSFDAHGLPLSATSSGGTDTASAGAKSSIEYWPVTAPPHARAMPHFVRDGEGADALTTAIDYPSDTQTKETDPRGVVTTTEADEWGRTVHVRVEKSGDPLILEQRFFYDPSGRLARQVEKKGSDEVTAAFAYDVMGRRTSSSVDHIATVGTVTTTTQYDLANRKIITTHPGGASTTTELDSLGRARRSVTSTGSSPIERQFAFDLAGNRVYATDMLTASAAAFDAHGRAVAAKAPDGTVTKSEYDEWDRPKSIKSLASDGATVGESTYDFTDAGRLRAMATKVDNDTSRQTEFAWDGAGRTTRFATGGRASKSVFDLAGRMQSYAAGAGDLHALSEIVRTNVTAYDGAAPSITSTSESNQPATVASMDRNAAGDVVRSNVGPLEWNQQYDELGNVTQASVPGRPATKWNVDARGAVATETLADGAENQFAYHGSGAQTNYSDPTHEATGTQTDLLGRPLSRSYPDGTSETIEWEGPRVHRIVDRQGREQVFKYNSAGQLEEVRSGNQAIETLGYDSAGRLVRWTNADSEITWSDFDLDGNPKKTGQKRFRDGSGLSPSPQLLNEFVQEHRWNEHGERKAFTIPGTQTWIEQDYDAMGNVTSITRGGIPLMSATYRSAGRPQTRTVFTPTPIVRTYSYDDATSLLKSMTVTVGANVVAGSEVGYDGLQKSSLRLLGVSSQPTNFSYDARSRLVTADRSTEVLNPADFRNAEERTPQLDEATRAALQSRGIDTAAIDPPSSAFDEQAGHKIKRSARGAEVRPFGYNGAERVDDGRFTYEFDVKGRLIRATEKSGPARYTYQYSATGRLIGRGDTTFVWDPISDRLIAVVGGDGTVQKEIIHGDAAYDDPLEVLSGTTPLFPLFDEAGTGALQAVLNDHAEVVARNVPNDPYGAENTAFTGAAIDRVSIQAKKTSEGTLESVEVLIHATEPLAANTAAAGGRLATIDNKAVVVRSTSVPPSLSDPYTLHWTLTPTEWQALVDPTPVGTPPAARTPTALS
ncbi:MAG TPA: Ig-like domain-containing protein, partial [Vicinamibacterales bacterium]